MTITNIDWAKIRKLSSELLTASTVVEHFRQQMKVIFVEMLADKPPPYSRRPIASLRLICDTGLPAKMIVHPGWSRGTRTVCIDRIECELLQESVRICDGQPAREFDKRINLVITPAKRDIGMMHATGAKDVMTVLQAMEDFLENPQVVFARSHDHCCCCGKHLTDTLSRSRGIGPECIQRIGHILVKQLDWNRLVQEEVLV